jgi:DNA polymerase III sliding clamp (beta) subunit (PCNA family)
MNTETLKGVLSIVVSTTKSDVAVKVEADRLSILSNSPSHVVSVSVKGCEHGDIFFCITHDAASTLLKTLSKSGDVKMKLVDEHVELNIRKMKFKIKLLPDDSVDVRSLLSKFKRDPHYTTSAKALQTAFASVRHNINDSIIGDMTLRGVHMSLTEEDSIGIMSTNIRAMAVTSFLARRVSVRPPELPAVVIVNPEFIGLCSAMSGEINLNIQSSIVSLHNESETGTVISVVSTLISGKIQDYNAILSRVVSKAVSKLTLDKSEFVECLKVNGFFADTENKLRATVTFSGDEVHISTANSKGEATTQLTGQKGLNNVVEDLTISLPSDTITKAAGSITSENVTLFYGGVNDPIILQDTNTAHVLVVYNQRKS